MKFPPFSKLVIGSKALCLAVKKWIGRSIHPSEQAPLQDMSVPPPVSTGVSEVFPAIPPTPISRDDDSMARLIGKVVDVVDLLSGMISRATGEEHRSDLVFIRTSLIEKIEAQGATLIDDDEWHPERQKPIAIQPASDPMQSTPRILRKGSTGFLFKGVLRRKQEVVLLQNNAPISPSSRNRNT